MRCNCERGGPCTLISACQVDSIVDDETAQIGEVIDGLLAEVERLNKIIEANDNERPEKT